MTTVDELRSIARKANSELYAAEQKIRDEENSRLIGNCFKYRNSGAGSGKQWWLYIRVMRTENGSLRVFRFEKMVHGIIEIEPEAHMMAVTVCSYMPIGLAEFKNAWKKLSVEVRELNP